MKRRMQRAWALVTNSGHIDTSSMRYCRKDVIRDELKEMSACFDAWGWNDLSDAQRWRKLKRRYSYSVRRITMRVIR